MNFSFSLQKSQIDTFSLMAFLGFFGMQKCQKLSFVQVAFPSGSSKHVLGKAEKIQELYLRACSNLSYSLLEACPSIQRLSLINCDVTDQILQRICAAFQNIQTISLNQCGKLTDAGYMHITKLQKLRHLDIRDTLISLECLKIICKKCAFLTLIDVTGNQHLKEQDVHTLQTSKNGLTILR